MNEDKRKAILELFESAVLGSTNTEAKRELESLLIDDPEAQAFYVEQCQMHAMLAWEHGSLPAQDTVAAGLDAPAQTTSGRDANSFWKLTAIAASLLFIVSSAFSVHYATRSKNLAQTQQPDASEGQPATETQTQNMPSDPASQSQLPWADRDSIASLSRSISASLTAETDARLRFAAGNDLRSGSYALTEGLIELTFPNAVQVIVDAPAKFELVNSMQMVLQDGSMSAKVPESGKGFQVLTPDGQLIDYGTEFAVEVRPNQGTEYHVFKGEVKVQPYNAPPNAGDLTLLAGQAASIRAESGIPEGIDIAADRYMRYDNVQDDTSSEHYKLLESLSPTMWLNMAPSGEADVLTDKGSFGQQVRIRRGAEQVNTFKPGQSGASVFFPGPIANSYATVEDYQPIETGSLTVCAWVRADSRPRWASIAKHWSVEIADDGQPVGLGGQFHFGLHEDSGELEVQILDNQQQRIKLRDSTPFPIAQWQHVAFVADGKEVRLFRNGVEVDTQPSEGFMMTGPAIMGIGAKLKLDGSGPDETNPGYWHGRIDELAIFDKPLSAEQIQALYQCFAQDSSTSR